MKPIPLLPLGAAVMLAAMSLVSCQPAPVSKGDSLEQGPAIRKKAGETFTIPLKANVTTGYSWTLDGTEDSTVVRKVGGEYVSDLHPPGMAGVGGTDFWRFRAEKPGKTVLHFIYRRAWEKDVKPVQERSFQVQVE